MYKDWVRIEQMSCGRYVIFSLTIPECCCWGESKDQAIHNFMKMFVAYLDRQDEGESVKKKVQS